MRSSVVHHETCHLLQLPTEILLAISEMSVLDTEGRADLIARKALLFSCRRLHVLVMADRALWSHLSFHLYLTEDTSHPRRKLKRALRIFDQSIALAGDARCFLDAIVSVTPSRSQIKAIDKEAHVIRRRFLSVAAKSWKISYQVPYMLYPLVIWTSVAPRTQVMIHKHKVANEKTNTSRSTVEQEHGALCNESIDLLGGVPAHAKLNGIRVLHLCAVAVDSSFMQHLARFDGLSELSLARIQCYDSRERFNAMVAEGLEFQHLTKLSVIGRRAVMFTSAFRLSALQVAYVDFDGYPYIPEPIIHQLISTTPIQSLSITLFEGLKYVQLGASRHLKYLWLRVPVNPRAPQRNCEALRSALSCQKLQKVFISVIDPAQLDNFTLRESLRIFVEGCADIGDQPWSANVPIYIVPDVGARQISPASDYLQGFLQPQQTLGNTNNTIHRLLKYNGSLSSIGQHLQDCGDWQDPSPII